ncbi:MAG: metallophosphatase family protein [Gammaproteobacteria bacterium]|nr:metallophosphatase family protein [Gammaproteobacteria bacterium]MDH3560570.1 metallophosphatase family protein [Gammaproteobacteria bacterium]
MALIGLISDVHATPAPVAEALSIFQKAGVEQVFCAGDIAGYREQLEQTVALLAGSGCQTVVGNHDLLYLDHYADELDNEAVAFFKQLPASLETVIAGKRVYMVHAHPPDACHGGIKLLNRQGEVQSDRVALWAEQLQAFDCDVLVVGHTHQVFAVQMGNTLVVNPGSSAFNHSCAILRLPEMTVQVLPLSGKAIERTWNWGDHVIGSEITGASTLDKL